MTPPELKELVEKAIEAIENEAGTFSAMINAVAGREPENADLVAIGGSLAMLRHLAHDHLDRIAGDRPRIASAATLAAAFMMQLARLEMATGDMLRTVAKGEDVNDALSEVNASIIAVVMLRHDLPTLQVTPGQA